MASAPQWRSNQWFDLTAGTRIVGAGHREEFTIGAARGQFRGLRLTALGQGTTSINNVTIEFTDGSRQQMLVKQKLGIANPAITIDLDGNFRSISRVLVYGLSGDNAAYKLQAL
jgi:hypothetical protein